MGVAHNHRNPGFGSCHDRRNHVVACDLVMTQVTYRDLCQHLLWCCTDSTSSDNSTDRNRNMCARNMLIVTADTQNITRQMV